LFFSPVMPFSLSLPTFSNPDTTHTPSWPTTIMKREESHTLWAIMGWLHRDRPNHLILSHEWTEVRWFSLGVIIFGSVRFLSKNVTKKNLIEKFKPKPVQTDRFRFG
jgi:hypothetical protein